MKFGVFWDVAPCSHAEVDQRFRGAYCLHHQDDEALMMESVRTSETSVNFNMTTRRYIPEDSKLHTRRRENVKSQILSLSEYFMLIPSTKFFKFVVYLTKLFQ
jgi:hypothetical protein